MTPPNATPNPNAHLHPIATITAGSRHANALPLAPEGRPLVRVWTVIDADKVLELGPVHNVSAFLEDAIHDYQVRDGQLHYYSRVTPTDAKVEVVLDYETQPERQARLAATAREHSHAVSAGPAPRRYPG